MPSSSPSRTRPLCSTASSSRPRRRTGIHRPANGMFMWRAVGLLACVVAVKAAVFTEGGLVKNGLKTRVRDQNNRLGTSDPEYDLALEEYLKSTSNGGKLPNIKEMEEIMSETGYLPELIEQLEQDGDVPEEKSPGLNNFQIGSDSEIQAEIDKLKKQYEKMIREQPDIGYEEIRKAEENLENWKNEDRKAAEDRKNRETDAELLEALAKVDRMGKEIQNEYHELLENKKAEKQHAEKIQKPVKQENPKPEASKEAEMLQKLQENLKYYDTPAKEEKQKSSKNQEEVVEKLDTILKESDVPKVPQKKGQNEFVSFVEPDEQKVAKQQITSNSLDKRRLATSADASAGSPRGHSGLLLVAVGAVMCVGIVGTVATGYVLKKRNETPDDADYAPYAGVGPGYKKNKGNKGDETLAYKAQLHQYQQAKQKIICGEDAPGIIESDGEEGADEENNFSVYECPGLAPTGDIEVCNPNFTGHR